MRPGLIGFYVVSAFRYTSDKVGSFGTGTGENKKLMPQDEASAIIESS